MPVRNKVKVRELDWVVECSDAVVLASYAGDVNEKLPLGLRPLAHKTLTDTKCAQSTHKRGRGHNDTDSVKT